MHKQKETFSRVLIKCSKELIPYLRNNLLAFLMSPGITSGGSVVKLYISLLCFSLFLKNSTACCGFFLLALV